MKLSENKIKSDFVLSCIVYISSLISFTYTFIYENKTGYELLPILPLIYGVIYFTLLRHTLNGLFPYFNYILILFSYFRYVILPFFIVYSGYYGGRSPAEPTSESFYNGLLLMLYELIVISCAVYILDKKYQNITHKSNQEFNSKGTSPNQILYWLFIIVSCLALLINSEVRSIINFIIPKVLSTEEYSDLSLLTLLFSYAFMISKQLLFVLIVFKLYTLFTKYRLKRYRYLALIAVLVNSCIYIGTNRLDIIICGLASILTYILVFRVNYKRVLLLLAISLFVVIQKVAEVRELASISKNSSKLIDFTDMMQVYLGGPYNVAMSIETEKRYSKELTYSILMFDFIRPVIGVNYIVKDLDISYTNIYFNKRYFNYEKRSQILPMIGQGYIHLGPVLAPFLAVIFIILIYLIRILMHNSYHIELVYFFTLALCRGGFIMGQNSMNILNDISYNLLFFLIIYFINKRIYFVSTSKLRVA